MTKEIFDKIFDWGIHSFIMDIQNNNPLIKTNDLQECKKKAYENYKSLIYQYLVSKKFVSFKKPMNPSKFQTHPAVLELFALCAIPAVSLKGRKNTSANNA